MFQTKVTFAPGQTPEQRKAHAAIGGARTRGGAPSTTGSASGGCAQAAVPPKPHLLERHARLLHAALVGDAGGAEGISARLHDWPRATAISQRTPSIAPASRRATSSWL